MVNQCFLDINQFWIVDFNVQIVMCDYYNVRGQNDIVYGVLVVYCFGVFDFSYNFCVVVGVVCQVVCVVQIFVVVWEGDGQIVNVYQCSGLNIGFVFFGQCFSRKFVVEFVNVFIVRQWVVDGDFGKDFYVLDFKYF